MLKRLKPRIPILVAAGIVIACGSEQALVSPRLDGTVPLGAVTDTGTPVLPVSRLTALGQNETWSFDALPTGNTVHHPSTGLTIVIPPGAVAAKTHITVTALKGAPIAYRFEPHGIHFAVPIQLKQSLRGAKIRGALADAQLFAGYFPDDSLVTNAGTGQARVFEIQPILIDVKGYTAILSIPHFCGWTVASQFGMDSLSSFGDR
jgi:hypothetical protein